MRWIIVATWVTTVAVLAETFAGLGLGALLVFAAIWGGPALVLAGVLGFWLGRSPARTLVVALAGVLALVGVASVGSAPTADCYECVDVLGRPMGLLGVTVFFGNVLSWSVGAFIGAEIRRRYRPRNSGFRFSVNAVRPSRASSDANER